MNSKATIIKNQVVTDNNKQTTSASAKAASVNPVKDGSGKKQKRKAKKNAKKMSREEISAAVEEISASMESFSWREVEKGKKFTKNDKLLMLSAETLIIGCDIGSVWHYARAVNTRGIEVSEKAFKFRNCKAGFESFRKWALDLMAVYREEEFNYKQIVVALEPTGHYWQNLAGWCHDHKISVVQINPYAVKQYKEVEDNSQDKSDTKDPKTIANLAIGGNYSMPYIPEGTYAELRALQRGRDQYQETRIAAVNRIHRLISIHFPEYTDVFDDIVSATSLILLMNAPFPSDIIAAGVDGLKAIMKENKLRGTYMKKLNEIVDTAKDSIGSKEGLDTDRYLIREFAKDVKAYDDRISYIESQMAVKVCQITNADKLLKIDGISYVNLTGVLCEIGDINRFDDNKEIVKLSGLGIVSNSSGKHNGQKKISKRGRKRLRYWLFMIAKSLIMHNEEWREYYDYFRTRDTNPLKYSQAVVAVASKFIRVLYAVLTKGVVYDAAKMKADIKRAAA